MVKVRMSDGQLESSGKIKNATPAFGSLTIDDATGLAVTNVALTVMAGAPMAAGESYGTTVALATGKITILRAGKYRVGFSLGEVVGVNSQAAIYSVHKNATELSPKICAKITQPATALAIVSLAAEGIVDLAVGDEIALFTSGSTGACTVKRARLNVVQLSDATSDQTA